MEETIFKKTFEKLLFFYLAPWNCDNFENIQCTCLELLRNRLKQNDNVGYSSFKHSCQCVTLDSEETEASKGSHTP